MTFTIQMNNHFVNAPRNRVFMCVYSWTAILVPICDFKNSRFCPFVVSCVCVWARKKIMFTVWTSHIESKKKINMKKRPNLIKFFLLLNPDIFSSNRAHKHRNRLENQLLKRRNILIIQFFRTFRLPKESSGNIGCLFGKQYSDLHVYFGIKSKCICISISTRCHLRFCVTIHRACVSMTIQWIKRSRAIVTHVRHRFE